MTPSAAPLREPDTPTPDADVLDRARGVPPGLRTLRIADAPSVSVVLVSRGPRSQLELCLRVLLPACRAARAELVVVRAGDDHETDALGAAHPGVRMIVRPAGTEPAELRRAGMAAAGGDIVTLLCDDRVPAPERLAHLAGRDAPRPAPA